MLGIDRVSKEMNGLCIVHCFVRVDVDADYNTQQYESRRSVLLLNKLVMAMSVSWGAVESVRC